jgi:glycosyltransferase involved in cell wall biosynthesis
MRVAYVSADPGVPAFASRADSVAIRDVCVAILDHGFDLSLFLANRGGAPPAKLTSVPVTDLRAPIAGDPDTHTRDTLAFNGDTAAALARSGPFDIIYERAARWSAAPMHYAARRSALGILQLGAALVRELADDTTPHALATRALLKSALCSAHLVIAPCDEVAATARTLAEDKANIHIIPDGCDPRTLAQSADSHQRGDFVIGYVGLLDAGAGLEVLVDAVATLVATRVPHAKLLIIGDGPGRNDLVKRVARRGLTQAVTVTTAGADDCRTSSQRCTWPSYRRRWPRPRRRQRSPSAWLRACRSSLAPIRPSPRSLATTPQAGCSDRETRPASRPRSDNSTPIRCAGAIWDTRPDRTPQVTSRGEGRWSRFSVSRPRYLERLHEASLRVRLD